MKTKLFTCVVIVAVCHVAIAAERTPSFQPLPDLPEEGVNGCAAHGVSGDGSVIVGDGNSESDQEAVRWEDVNLDGQSEVMSLDRNWPYPIWALDASADGSVVVGVSRSQPLDRAFRWTEATGIEYLPTLPAIYPYAWAYGVSADGRIIAGGSGVLPYRACIWVDGAAMSLGDLPGGITNSWGEGISADGLVVVGYGHSASGQEAFRWKDLNGNGLVDPDEKLDVHPEFGLGDLPGGDFKSIAYAVSCDGSTVVGSGTSPDGIEAFIWDDSRGMRRLEDVLMDEYGLGPDEFDPDWTLTSAQDVSCDGSVIVGAGISPFGETQGWVVVVPEPATLSLLTLGGLAVLRRRSR